VIPAFWTSQPVDLQTALFEPLNINVAVAGVEVGSVLAWIQRKMINTRTLNFTIYLEKDRALITGSLNAIDPRDNVLRIELSRDAGQEKIPLDRIADSVAYELTKRQLAKDPSNKIEVLDRDEFQTLLTVLTEAARLNRSVALGRPVQQQFTALFPKAEGLARQVPEWYQLNYLAASIAESAENREQALFFYKRVQEVIIKNQDGTAKIDPGIREKMQAKVKVLESEMQSTIKAGESEALKNIYEYALYAVDFYNKIFDMNRTVPPIELLKADSKNSYLDQDNSYHVPPSVQYLPDIIYQQMAYPFIQAKAALPYIGQSGAIFTSYAQILASLVKQKRLEQSAHEANWLLAEGFIAWIKNEDVLKASDKSALVSLKAPGTAYDDPIVGGKDPQPAHMKDYKNLQTDNGGVHINTGILNKAFYEAAVRLGSDQALDIWVKALPKLASAKPQDFQTLAKITFDIAGENTEEQKEKVREAWAVVGLDPTLPNSVGARKS
jgi:hypothetical protein